MHISITELIKTKNHSNMDYCNVRSRYRDIVLSISHNNFFTLETASTGVHNFGSRSRYSRYTIFN